MKRWFSKLSCPYCRRVASVALAFVLLLLASWYDVTGGASALNRYASEQLDRAWSQWFAGVGECPDRCADLPGRDAVSVLLIDQAYVQAHSWPPTFTMYAAMIDAMLDHGVKVIFLDVVSKTKPADDVTPFLSSLERAIKAGVHIIAAQVPAHDTAVLDCPKVGPRLDGLLDRSVACAVSAVAPIAWRTNLATLAYPIRIARSEADTEGDVTPGIAAAIAWLGPESPASRAVMAQSEGYRLLLWGPEGASVTGDCSRYEPEAGRGILERAVSVFVTLLKRDQYYPQPCTYIPQGEMSTVLAGQTVDNRYAWSVADHLLRNRAVFVGAKYDGVRDSIMSPLGRELPGVFLHATAAANLISTGGDRDYAFEADKTAWHDTTPVIEVLTIVGVALLRLISRRWFIGLLCGGAGRDLPRATEQHTGRYARVVARGWHSLQTLMFWTIRATLVAILMYYGIGPLLGIGHFEVATILLVVLVIQAMSELVTEVAMGWTFSEQKETSIA